jgi:hypothetical protein
MKTKVVLIGLGVLLVAAAALHLTHQPPKDGMCPLGKAIHGK